MAAARNELSPSSLSSSSLWPVSIQQSVTVPRFIVVENWTQTGQESSRSICSISVQKIPDVGSEYVIPLPVPKGHLPYNRLNENF